MDKVVRGIEGRLFYAGTSKRRVQDTFIRAKRSLYIVISRGYSQIFVKPIPG